MNYFCKIFFTLCASFFIDAPTSVCREVIPARENAAPVPVCKMQNVYEKVKTPFKYGIVLKGENGKKVDSPSVFRFNDQWYMMYIIFDGDGYETAIAQSSDLLSWAPLGKILSKKEQTWDANQAAGYAALQDHLWGGSCTLQQHDDKFWLSYLGGALTGYETDPLSIGIAWTLNPGSAQEWDRLLDPVLIANQEDSREWEKLTLYKSNIVYDRSESLGFPFVMFYNAKSESGYERIGMAVSQNMQNWARYGNDPVIDNGKGLSGDPQVVKIGDVWVMFYFGAFWKPGAFDTFACSYDLVNWTKWQGPHLVQPSESWDNKYAHKPWVIYHDGVVYHFYCAVGNEGRVIALATSRDLKSQSLESENQ